MYCTLDETLQDDLGHKSESLRVVLAKCSQRQQPWRRGNRRLSPRSLFARRTGPSARFVCEHALQFWTLQRLPAKQRLGESVQHGTLLDNELARAGVCLVDQPTDLLVDLASGVLGILPRCSP